MPVPWLQLVDAALGVANFARGRKAPSPPPEEQSLQLEGGSRAPGGLEARLAGVVVAALREAFERDTRRLDLEREQAEAERERAERALRLELRRQAADREIARLRLLAGVAVIAWLGTHRDVGAADCRRHRRAGVARIRLAAAAWRDRRVVHWRNRAPPRRSRRRPATSRAARDRIQRVPAPSRCGCCSAVSSSFGARRAAA